jgi:tetratricopeptide (TPR) repeat protein
MIAHLLRRHALTFEELIEAANRHAIATDADLAQRFAEQALQMRPEHPDAFAAMAVAANADSRHAEAKRWFEKAAESAPQSANFRVNLGYARVLEGDFDGARKDFDAAIRIDPDNVGALQNIVWITRFSSADPLIDKIRALAARCVEGDEDYIKLNYMLGKALDDIGEYDDAFAAYRRANKCQPSHYDYRQHQNFFDAVGGVWTRERLDYYRSSGNLSRKPVFIIGMPRSGSTLVEEKLAADSRFVGLGEVPDIIRMSGAVQRNHPQRAPFPFWCADAPLRAFGGLGDIYLKKYEARHPDAMRLINKSLLNFAYAGMIEAMFPNALIIETRRNPIDTCLSCYFKDLKAAHQYSVRLETLGEFYRLYDGLMREWRSRLSNLVTVRYEDFISDANSSLASLKEAAGVESPAAGAAEPGARHVQTFSAWQVKQPLYTHAVERWRRYEKHIGPLIDALGDLA